MLFDVLETRKFRNIVNLLIDMPYIYFGADDNIKCSTIFLFCLYYQTKNM